ncbi:MAG: RagB/SusD family nutrient uptake outer membrane protein [Sphingobacteriales bacterium]
MTFTYNHQKQGLWMLILFSCISCMSCKKLVNIPEPTTTITTSETFSTDATATSALIAIYNNLVGGSLNFGNGGTTIYSGLSADELNYFYGPGSDQYQYQTNTLLSANNTVSSVFWTPAYFNIYQANAVIEGLQTSSGVSAATKKQLTGEAKFLRAFCFFNLVNLFGDVPLVTTTAWAHTDMLSRAPVTQIYQQIIADLKDAQNTLPDDYSVSGGERIRVNKSGATALLARVYLYQGKWESAEAQASLVIGNTGLYNLVGDLNTAFLKNSNEAILQWGVNNDVWPYATQEGFNIVPYDTTTNPNYYLTSQLLSAFEKGDQRRVKWVDSTDYLGTYYYFPFKYKVYTGTQGNITEYFMVLRLAEQYLIRAEAEANGAPGDPIADLNIIRHRAGLPNYTGGTGAPLLAAIAQERRIELFAESGHRWFDLKRTGKTDSVLARLKPQWQTTQKLYPIPKSELVVDPNLTQNPGY